MTPWQEVAAATAWYAIVLTILKRGSSEAELRRSYEARKRWAHLPRRLRNFEVYRRWTRAGIKVMLVVSTVVYGSFLVSALRRL